MLKKYKNRLYKLATYLRTVPKKKFDMGTWKDHCGTTCCAGGHACNIESFNEEGLEWYYGCVSYDGRFYWDALRYFFGITSEECTYIFYMQANHRDVHSPKRASSRIMKVLKSHLSPSEVSKYEMVS